LWKGRNGFAGAGKKIGYKKTEKLPNFGMTTRIKKWYLYWMDRNSRWHEYLGIEPSSNLDRLLEEVEEDPTGIFWG